MWVGACGSVCVYVCVGTYWRVHVRVDVCGCMWLCVYMYVWGHIGEYVKVVMCVGVCGSVCECVCVGAYRRVRVRVDVGVDEYVVDMCVFVPFVPFVWCVCHSAPDTRNSSCVQKCVRMRVRCRSQNQKH